MDGTRKRVTLLVLARAAGWFLLCFSLSAVAYRASVQRWPSLVEAALSLTLLAPLSIPKACADLLGLTNPRSLAGLLPAVGVYWTLVGGLAVGRLARDLRPCGWVIAALLLAATPRWVKVSVALLHL